jgi:ribosomal protein S18 acetylase RimI-like enzyme
VTPSVRSSASRANDAGVSTLVRAATTGDAARVSHLGATTFRAAFEAQNTPEDMARYLAETFTVERQAAEIADRRAAVLVAEQPDTSGGAADAELVGYAHLVFGSAPAFVHGPAPVELKRLYVDRAWHGQGVAQALMDAAIAAARARGAETMWLGVWEHNPRAAAFYAKYGFARVGEHTFLLGDDAQTDWVLARPLRRPPPP